MDKQTQWAVALKKAQQQGAKQQRVSKDVQKKQLQEEMAHFKTKLVDAAKKKKADASEKYLVQLIELRAKQLVILLENLKETFGPLDKGIVRYHTKKYHQDCIKLAVMANILLGTDQRV